MTERTIMTDKKKAYMKAYREKHKEDIKEYNKKYCKVYYKHHKEEIKERAITYNLNHKEKHKESARKCAENAYLKAKQEITTCMYKFTESVVILDDKHISYNGVTYCINKGGYLSHQRKMLHIEIAKNIGIWFEGCDIHHINNNVFDNTNSNLIALTKEKHRYAHFLLKEDTKQYYNWIEKQRAG